MFSFHISAFLYITSVAYVVYDIMTTESIMTIIIILMTTSMTTTTIVISKITV